MKSLPELIACEIMDTIERERRINKDDLVLAAEMAIAKHGRQNKGTGAREGGPLAGQAIEKAANKARQLKAWQDAAVTGIGHTHVSTEAGSWQPHSKLAESMQFRAMTIRNSLNASEEQVAASPGCPAHIDGVHRQSLAFYAAAGTCACGAKMG